MYARWEDALDAQLDTYTFSTSDFGRRYASFWSASFAKKQAEWEPDTGFWRQVIDGMPGVLFNAEPIWVEPEMQTLWESAATSFHSEPLIEADLITDTGFCYLPRPMLLHGMNERATSCRAFAWAKTANGVLVYVFHRVGDPDDFERKGMEPVRDGAMLLDHVLPWAFGLSAASQRIPDGATNVGALIQCGWRLMNQTITTKEPGRPAKPWRRRLQKAKMAERNVVVIRLRRPKAQPHEDDPVRHVEWSHRWLVSGHWRNQWYPSAGAHRQIWISPFIKGPEDKPLEVRKTRIFDWSR